MLEAETDQSHAVVGEVLASEAVQQLAVDVTNVESWRVKRVRETVAERCAVDQVDQSLIIAHKIFQLFICREISIFSYKKVNSKCVNFFY